MRDDHHARHVKPWKFTSRLAVSADVPEPAALMDQAIAHLQLGAFTVSELRKRQLAT
jgi:hypothetical protein